MISQRINTVIFFLLISSFLWSCSGDKNKQKIKSGPDLSSQQFDAITAASLKNITEQYEAVGTIRPKTETSIQSLVTARIVDVKVNHGDTVEKGDVLVSLDNRQLIARVDQAKQALNAAISGEMQAKEAIAAANAAYNQADAAYKRIKKYFSSQAATSTDLEKAESQFLQAKAGLKQAEQALEGARAGIKQAKEFVREAEIALGHTEIKAPEKGEVLKRLVELGDLAIPGKPLIVLRTSGLLRLEAYVREGLIKKVTPGTKVDVIIDTLKITTSATIEEIIPYADPKTRTFLVKAALPYMEGLYPGMFGKFLIPVKQRNAVIIPKKAVRHVGQLEIAWVKENEEWESRYIKTGKSYNDQIEVLSGLSGKEKIGY